MSRWAKLVAPILSVTVGMAVQAGPIPDWHGFYAGGFVGKEWNSIHYWEPDWPGFGLKPTVDGYVKGFLLGYNVQDADQVYGIEADRGFARLSVGRNPYARNNYSAFETGWNAHIRGRYGYVHGPFLIYAAAGLCFIRIKIIDTDPRWSDAEGTHTGWGGGVGVDYAMARHVWVRAEYLYDDFGSRTYVIQGLNPYRASTSLSGHTVRIGMMVRF